MVPHTKHWQNMVLGRHDPDPGTWLDSPAWKPPLGFRYMADAESFYIEGFAQMLATHPSQGMTFKLFKQSVWVSSPIEAFRHSSTRGYHASTTFHL